MRHFAGHIPVEPDRPCVRHRAVVLRGGTYFLGAPLEVGRELSGLVLMSYPAEAAWLSGAKPLEGEGGQPLAWRRVAGAGNVWSATLPEGEARRGPKRSDPTTRTTSASGGTS